MNRKLCLTLAVTASIIAASTALYGSNSIATLKEAARDIPKEKDQLGVQSALLEFQKVAQMEAYFEGCYGVAIFPTIAKGGLGIGGAHGTGWVFRQSDYTGEVKMNQLTVGWQAGGQAYSQIIFFENEASYLSFTSGNFEFGAQASAVAITAGASAAASTAGGSSAGSSLTGVGATQTKLDYTGGMAVFTVAKGGLMYEAAIGGQKFKFRPAK